MKKILSHYAVLALLGLLHTVAHAAVTNEWGPITNNLEMSLRLAGDLHHLKAGQAFSLSIRYKNLSTNEPFPLRLPGQTPLDDSSYAFTVTSPSGADVSPKIEYMEPLSGAMRRLDPGKTFEVEFDLSKLCKFDQVGTYKIIAKKREMWWPGKSETFEIISNTLEVKVLVNEEKP